MKNSAQWHNMDVPYYSTGNRDLELFLCCFFGISLNLVSRPMPTTSDQALRSVILPWKTYLVPALLFLSWPQKLPYLNLTNSGRHRVSGWIFSLWGMISTACLPSRCVSIIKALIERCRNTLLLKKMEMRFSCNGCMLPSVKKLFPWALSLPYVLQQP